MLLLHYNLTELLILVLLFIEVRVGVGVGVGIGAGGLVSSLHSEAYVPVGDLKVVSGVWVFA